MPRITGADIAEHVAAQEVAVVEAAKRLFAERGVAAVPLGEIAAAVGLQRTSLYRYFPTKAHILQRWFDQEMDPLIERCEAAVVGHDTPADALRAWLDVQFDFVTDAAHTALMKATLSAGELPPEVMAHFMGRHRALYVSLDPILRAGGASSAELQRTRGLLIAGLITTAGDLVRQGGSVSEVRAELHRAGAAVAAL